MGQKIVRFDDLDETQDDTVAVREFSVGRNGWQMDLTDENYQTLLDGLAPFIAKAKKVRGPGIKASGPRVGPATSVPLASVDDDPGTAAPSALRFTDSDEPSRLADWAVRNGVRIARPGRPPRSVLAAFRADDVSLVPDAYRLVSA